ncbi:MAG: beta-eliminating lyase-related protein [Steroidobacteraceae bacterium]
MNFLSDNTASICPPILEAILRANPGSAASYGEDEISSGLDEKFSRFFERDVRVFPVLTGTAANALALASVCPPHGSILAHKEAHLLVDECGAPEFFSGARVVPVSGAHGRIDPRALADEMRAAHPSVHALRPTVLSLTQSTELGTVYTASLIRDLATSAHREGLLVHVDGARFANALASSGSTPAGLSWACGVDVMSLGFTKLGAMLAEAVVFFDPALVADFERRRKRSGQLFSKMRYVSAQLIAMLENDLWLENARRMNALATRIGDSAEGLLAAPVEANSVFLRLDAAAAQQLQQRVACYPWGAQDSMLYRLVVSWNQPEEEVDRLCELLRQLPR